MEGSRPVPPVPAPLRRVGSDTTATASAGATGAARSTLASDGSPGVSKPHNVKRLLHVEWDAATGAFKVCGGAAVGAVFTGGAGPAHRRRTQRQPASHKLAHDCGGCFMAAPVGRHCAVPPLRPRPRVGTVCTCLAPVCVWRGGPPGTPVGPLGGIARF